MKPLRTHKGSTVSIMLDNIDTDQIIPKQYLKRIERTGFGEFLFDEWRYHDDRSPNQSFVLNNEERKNATILISGHNFGCGSSREHAPWALHDYGFTIVIAGSFADIFYNNCIKNGMLPIVLEDTIRQKLVTLKGDQEIEIDLEHQLVKTPFGDYEFTIDSVWKDKLLNGLDDIAITMQYEDKIEQYESVRV
ncbi:3-isopropylmalate dehydratase small subunit [Gottfriedia solisilvae]|uniref:3-isopropylmalate dehydratase small subunit n=1 Tax=Gottfriedia solisilvae TaxID=1516104 RepID=A0A8J3AIF5_9BACI|nr:3-isopropylmalate dehydratase small subunit [Gottfriedia solisilvae]GGI13425.1 3-isopropylmalate dehydratase small subunit [Gottfriedia solisilvae]